MIAQRFRPIGWVAGVATAATALYLVSLQVAAERGKLESVERQIARAQRDMRQLQTELGTRASLRQLEKWNGDVLALSAPGADQFVQSGAQLASRAASGLEPSDGEPPAVMTAALSVAPKTDDEPKLRRTSYEKPEAKPEKQATRRVAMIDTKLLGDLGQAAAVERRKRP